MTERARLPEVRKAAREAVLMIEEVAERVFGPWGIAAVLLVGTNRGRRALRGALKETIKFGMIAGETLRETYAEIQEEAADAVAEVKAELHSNERHSNGRKRKATTKH